MSSGDAVGIIDPDKWQHDMIKNAGAAEKISLQATEKKCHPKKSKDGVAQGIPMTSKMEQKLPELPKGLQAREFPMGFPRNP